MSLHPMRRVSLLDNIVSLHGSPHKSYQSNNQHHFSQNTIQSLSSFPSNIRQKIIQDPLVKIIQWRKNAQQNVVGIKNQKYSLIKTVNKCIKVPSNYQTQRVIKKLDTFYDLPITQSMLILLSIFQGCSNIVSFLGYITFELRFCGINPQGKVKVWINSDYKSNQPEGKVLKDQSQAVLKIIQEIKKISANQFSEFYCYYLRNARKNICDFKYTTSLIKSYCNCTKLILPQKVSILKFRDKNSYIKTVNNFMTPTNKEIKMGQRLSLAPDFLVKQTEDKTKTKDRPISNIKNSLSQTKIRLKKQQNSGKNRQEQNNSQIVKQFSFIIKPRQDLVKQSQISTTMKSNSNKRSAYLGQNNGLDWSMKTFNKVDKLPTHQSQNQFPKNFRDDEKNPDSLFEGIKEECNSENSPQKGVKADEDSIRIGKQKERQILINNKWTNKISSLFGSKEIKESQVLGKQPQQTRLPGKTQKLDKWARIIGESMLPQNQNN